MAQDADFVPATAADIASDMAHHRKAYRGFLRLLTGAAIGSAALLVIVFFVLRSIPFERAIGGDPAPGIAQASPADPAGA